LSLCYFFSPDYGVDDHIYGALGALRESGNKQLTGPRFGDESHFFDGLLDNGRLHKYQALWRQGNIVCELGLAGPPGYFKRDQFNALVAVQNARLQAELTAPLNSVDG
jgi:hypothetical protein